MNDVMSFTFSNDVDDLSYNFESVSIGLQGTESSYDDGSSSYNQDYYPPQTLAPDMVRPFPGYLIHSMYVAATQYEYDYHLDRYFHAHAHYMSWYDYCMVAIQSSLFISFMLNLNLVDCVELNHYGLYY